MLSTDPHHSAFGATAYTAGIKEVMTRFNVSLQVAILGMSIYFWVCIMTMTTPMEDVEMNMVLTCDEHSGRLLRTYSHTAFF